jgi:hypothetical protein
MSDHGLVIWDCTLCGAKDLRTPAMLAETWCPFCHATHWVLRRVDNGAWSVAPSAELEIVGHADDGTPIARGRIDRVEITGTIVA